MVGWKTVGLGSQGLVPGLPLSSISQVALRKPFEFPEFRNFKFITKDKLYLLVEIMRNSDKIYI